MTGVGLADRPATKPAGPRVPPARRWVTVLRGHWPFAVLLAAGLVARVLVWIAYQPALIYVDSFRYLDDLPGLDPSRINPLGYDLFVLEPLSWFGDLRLVTVAQHVAGLGIAVALYALTLRYGARRWVAALAAVPVLFDAYELNIEQYIMADLWFQALIVLTLWLLTARGAPTCRRAGMAGLVLALAVLMRVVGVTLIVPAVAYLVLAGGAWRTAMGRRHAIRRIGALVGGFAVVLGVHGVYFMAFTGHFGLTQASGGALFGRAATVADCDKLKLSRVLQQLCPAEPLGQRQGIDHYAHQDGDPNWQVIVPPGQDLPGLMRAFGLQVVRQQPLDVLGGIVRDFGKSFAATKVTQPGDVPVDRWQFQVDYPLFDTPEALAVTLAAFGRDQPSTNVTVAGWLRHYQLGGGYTPGPALLGALLFALFGGFGAWRAARSGARAATLLAAGAGLTVLATAAAFEFSWRYQLPALVLIPLAGALGITALMGPRKTPPLPKRFRLPLADFPDAVDSGALDDFHDRHGIPQFAPIVVVIAAYNEAGGIGRVLDEMPSWCCGLPVDVLVVVDGGTDNTADIAVTKGVYTCVAPTNRGQGAALRIGYRLAAMHGADYVVTTDADGQYDITELPQLLRPLLDDEADFVTGSRRLGQEDTTDPVRWLGVRFFATLASLLTWRRITDTSFGFRAMRAELACRVTLRQPQYQSSELLVGMLAQRARLVELPMTMRQRSAGQSKKGGNVVYGLSYAKVMTGTWLREFVFRRGKPADQAPRTSRRTELRSSSGKRR